MKKLVKLEPEVPDVNGVGHLEAEADRGADDPLVFGARMITRRSNISAHLLISEWRAQTVLGGHRGGPRAHDTR